MVRRRNGVSLYYYDPNPQGRDAVVFVHGWPLNHQMFEYQFAALPECRLIGVDMRGFGRSDAPAGSCGYDDFADDLYAVVRHLELGSFTLVGFSMGGGVALHYMKKHRGYGVKMLVFMSAAAPCFTQQEGYPFGLEKEAVTSLIDAGHANRPAMLQDFNKLFFTGNNQDQAFKDWCTFMSYEASAAGTMQSLYTLRDADLRDDTQFVRVPTAIFHGKLDQVCLFEIGEQLHKMIPQSRLYPFEQSGHCIFHDELEKFNAEFAATIRER